MVKPPLERFREMYHLSQTRFEDPRSLPNLVNREFIKDESDYPCLLYKADAAYE